MSFDNEEPWVGTASAGRYADTIGLKVRFSAAKLLTDVAAKHSVTISNKGKAIAKLSLTGTCDAVEEVLTCQRGIDAILAY